MQITPYTAQKINLNYQPADNFIRQRFFMNKLSADTVCFTSKRQDIPHRKEYDEKDVLRIIGVKNYVNDENIELYKDILNTVDDKYYVHFLRKPDDLVDLKLLIERMDCSVDKKSKGILHCIIGDKYINKPEKDEDTAINSYKNDDNSDFNKLLTKQRYKNVSHNSAIINSLTKFLNKKETKDNMILYRGDTSLIFEKLLDKNGNSIGRKIAEIRRLSDKEAGALINEIEDDLNGKNFIQERFLSTTINNNVAEDYFNNGILWKFNLPKASQAAFIQNTDDNDTIVGEAEVLIQRDSLIDIKDVKYDKSLKSFRIKADITTTKDHV